MSTRSPPTRFSTPGSRAGSWWSAAAISRSSSPRCSAGSALKYVEVMRADNILRGFDDDMRAGLRDEIARAGVVFGFARLPTQNREAGEGREVKARRTARRSSRAGPDRDRPRAEHARAWAGGGGRAPRRQGRRRRRRRLDDQRRLDPRGRRRHRPHQPDAGGDPRGPWLADRLFGGGARAVNDDMSPTAVFTTPEIGTVGLTEARRAETHPTSSTSTRPASGR